VVDNLAEEAATRDGRTLTYLEAGEANGPLVIHNHGGPSRLEARLLADCASKNRLRLVPDPINKAVADRTPAAVRHPVAGAGHFVAVGSGDDVFAIAAEILGAA
jgi:hypothetical protein